MCRIFVSDMKFLRNRFKSITSLQKAFAELERLNGGDGNGVWLSGQNIIMRGPEFNTNYMAGYVMSAIEDPNVKDDEVMVFHTRIRSAGDISSRLNHPFRVGKETVLVHNGTMANWMQLARVSAGARKFEPQSDTEFIADLVAMAIGAYGENTNSVMRVLPTLLKHRPGVIVIANKDWVVVASSGSTTIFSNGRMLGAGMALVSSPSALPGEISEFNAVSDRSTVTIRKKGITQADSKIVLRG